MDKKIAVAKVCGDFRGGWIVGADGCQVPAPWSDSEVKNSVPASCGMGPRRTWNASWESLHKFVSPELLQIISAYKKNPVSVEKMARFCDPAPGGMWQALHIKRAL
jgi:hypothetical protein